MRKKFLHQSEFGDCLLHTWNALRANGTSPEFQIRFVCLKKVTSEFLEFLLKFTPCRNDGARHHNGVTTAAWTNPLKPESEFCVADHDIRRIDGKLLRQDLRHNSFGAVSPERRIELRENFA